MFYPKISVFLLAATMASSSLSIADDDDELPFDEARLFFELNDTDGGCKSQASAQEFPACRRPW